jgi:putative PIN family toxin of toxin-antitoxin system
VSEPRARRPRAVLDTNVLVRGLTRTAGPSREIFEALLGAGAFVLVTSAEILAELGDVLQRPAFRRHVEFTDFEIMRAIRGLRRVAQMVPGAYVELKAVPTDPDDNLVVACALEGGADYLVTDDRRDLLPLKAIRVPGHHVVQVVTPRGFLRVLGR